MTRDERGLSTAIKSYPSIQPNSSSIQILDGSLVVVQGAAQGATSPLQKELTLIGRSKLCDLVLTEDHYVSERHCELQWTSHGIRVRDLGSSNGTFLSGHRVMDAYLLLGDRLQVGDTIFELRSQGIPVTLNIHYRDATGHLVGKSESMRRLFDIMQRLSSLEISVHLTGQTGTGKSSIAKAIHERSIRRAKGPFVTVDCGALSHSLIESHLFGHCKGAFTGADKDHKGFFEQAHGGTLFLDEIGELPLVLQPKLLNVLQRRRIRRLGETLEREVDFRLITATHLDLRQEIQAGRFREDLFYRLDEVSLEVPSLQNRQEDIPLLVEQFLQEIREEMGLLDSPIQITTDALHKLQQYPWPGNIRQLRNMLKKALVFLNGHTITSQDLLLPHTADDDDLFPHTSTLDQTMRASKLQVYNAPNSLKEALEQAEQLFLENALNHTHWNVKEAAELLEIPLSTLYSRMKKFDLKRT